jgi:phage terminase small subunit
MKPAPKTLSAESRKLWREIVAQYGLEDPPGLAVLHESLAALDQARACRRRIRKDGEAIADRWGQVKPHPLLSAERDSRAAFFAGMKMLAFEQEPKRAGPGSPTAYDRWMKQDADRTR